MPKTRDWILKTKLWTPELCRVFHGIDCQIKCEHVVDRTLRLLNPATEYDKFLSFWERVGPYAAGQCVHRQIGNWPYR